MLEQMRRHSRSVIIYVLFGILITVFVISFGPQSGQSTSGCMPSSSYALKVRDREVGEHSWRFAIMAMYSSAATGQRARALRARETVMDKLIERELLAQAAESAGFRISTADVEARIADGEMFVLGQPVPGQAIYYGCPRRKDAPVVTDCDPEDKIFDYEMLERYAKALGLASVGQFVDEQRREMLAQKMRDMLQSSVRVAPEEVLDRYKQDNTRVEVEYVKLKPLDYRKLVEVTDADVAAWLAKHEDEVKKKYELDKNLYAAAAGSKWVKMRQIVVRRGMTDETGEGDPKAPDAGRARADAALARLKAGEDFAKVARDVSEEERSARRGGLTDWRQTTKLDPKLAAAVESLGKGKPSEVVEAAAGYYIVRVEDTAEGDLGYEQVKLDLAEPMARDEKAVAMARGDAEEALAQVKTGVPLATLFPSDEPDDGAEHPPEDEAPEMLDREGDPEPEPKNAPGDGEDAPKQPAQPKKPATGKDESGMIDRPARVQARQGDEKVRPVAPPVPAAKKPAVVDAKKPAAVDAKKPAAVPAPVPEHAKKPAAGAPKPGKLQQSGPLYRDGLKVRGIGESKELARAIFRELPVGTVGTEVYEVDAGDVVNHGFVIVRVTVRTDPDMEEFEKQKDSLARNYAFQKYFSLLDEWTSRRCLEAKADITVNATFVEYGDVDEKTGRPFKSTYQPCTSAAGPMMGGGMMGGGEQIDFGE